MRAVVMHEAGGADVLRVEEVPEPIAGSGEVVIGVEAVGVSHHETAMRAGTFPMPQPLPAVFGFEAAGTVLATGADADPGLVGQRVTAIHMGGGAYAERVAVPASSVVAIPDGVSAADAVAVALQGAIALCLLRAAAPAPGANVLVEVASGSIGGYLTQLLRASDVGRVVATVGGPHKVDAARALGADTVVDHRRADWPGQVVEALGGAGLDVVFESIGGAAATGYLDAMTPGTGRILFYGLLDGPLTLTPLDLLLRGLTLLGFGGAAAWEEKVRAARVEALAMVAAGTLRPLRGATLPLVDAAEAHRMLEARTATGKITLVP